ncbi:MAG: TonB family protein [Candidatus Fibromonas sp.]|jgi:TonB family protein|nr:TonB family protein [Candidatus Fibromonas sp.]
MHTRLFLSFLLFALSVALNSCGSSENKQIQQQAQTQTKMPENLPFLKIDGKENSDVYLQSLDIQVEVTGNIASTRYTMVLKNKTNRILEGELTFSLPDGRSITHYALDINGKMREAVPVEKTRGTLVFEEIERRRVDPGLLERVEGNNFRTRVYPIPKGGTRTISIGYEEELTLERGLLYYHLPMLYPDSLERFAVKATVYKSTQKPLVSESEKEIRFDMAGENYVASFARENYRPSSALIFTLPAPADIPQVTMQPAQGSHYFLASVAPKMESRKKQLDNDLAIIWDVSLSGLQRNLQREIEMLDIVFAGNKNANINLYFLNNTFKKIDSGNWDKLKNILETAVYDGGTDFSKIDLKNIAGNEILFFSDGLSTLSDADFLKNAKLNRPIHSIVSSAKADYSTMKLIAGKTRGKFVNVNALSSEKLRDALQNETLQFLGVEHGNSVREVYPSIATPVHGNFSVAGIADTNDAELTLLFGFGNKVEERIKVKLDAKSAASQDNTYKIWAQKKIAELDLDHEKNRDELTELGRQFGIVTRNISLIVLETASDYIRYNIEPPATEPELQTKPNGRRNSATGGFNEGYAEGGSGGIGDMLGGLMGGSAGGIANSSPNVKPPSAKEIDMGSGDGSRSKQEILAVVNARMPGLRNLYNKYLKLNDFSGKVTLKFTIAPGGDIINISIVSSTTGYADFDNAIKHMVSTWKWKAIKSGNCTPTIPFNFPEVAPKVREIAPEFREIIPESREGLTVNGAAAAAENLKKWWNINYPVPDEEAKVPDIYSAIDDLDKYKDYPTKLTGKAADDYQIYLKLRTYYANSPAFYFDMAGWFYTLGDRETALRILTSIADLELENAVLYRLLGYRFKEYGEYALEKFVCQKVIEWRNMEPQSYRDYALALADNGEAQAALDSLYSLLTKSYSKDIFDRSRGMEEVIVMEINHLIARNPSLNTSKIDKSLLINIPVDIRVVVNWNMDNTDIYLHVTDPNGKNCSSYSYYKTSIGERINAVRTGYGPKQFLLKKAVKGKYRIYVESVDRNQSASAGPLTIMAEIFTKYADNTEQRQVVTLQMSNASENNWKKTKVAEFEF